MVEKLRIHVSQLFVAVLVIFIGLSRSCWEDEHHLVTTALFVTGVFLVGVAAFGRLWCSVYIAGYKTRHLVTQGPYSMCRNPLYFFSLLGAVGAGLVTKTLTIPLLILIGFAMYYPLVILSEESALRKIHNGPFEEYLQTVPRFFPKISLLKEPEQYMVKPIVIKQHMFSALWFVWIVGILETVEGLHKLKILPAIFKLY